MVTRSPKSSRHRIVYRLSDQADLVSLGGKDMLFDAAEQQLLGLDDAGAFFAHHVRQGTTLDDVVGDLVSSGSDAAEAAAWSVGVLADWSRRGLVHADVPAAVCSFDRQTIRVAGLEFDIWYADADLRDRIGPIFRHLEIPPVHATACCRVARANESAVVIGTDFAPAAIVTAQQAGPALKALLFQQVIEAADCLAALHVACLVRGGAMLLVGPPGAGKSTLTLGLMAAGFRYAADDVCLLLPAGRVSGVRFAATAKEGSWPILERIGFDLGDLPVMERLDGQRVRFLPPSEAAPETGLTVRWIVRVNRDGRTPELRPLDPRDTLSALLGEGFAPSGQASVECMRAMTGLVAGADCRDLHYSDLGDAVRLLRELVDDA